MKRVLIIMLCMVLAASLVFAGCAAEEKPAEEPAEQAEEAAEETAEEPAEEPEEAPADAVAGGWTMNEEKGTLLDEEQTDIFNAGLEGLVGAEFQPVAVISTQVVAGMNYQFLCVGEAVTRDPVPAWDIVSIYVDTKDVCSVSSIKDLDIAEPVLMPADTSAKVGGWECALNGTLVKGDAAAAFAKTSGEYEGIKLTPAVLLGTQVVAGTNYKLLCKGEKDGKAFVCIATVYADLDGNAEITDCGVLDCGHYYEQEA